MARHRDSHVAHRLRPRGDELLPARDPGTAPATVDGLRAPMARAPQSAPAADQGRRVREVRAWRDCGNRLDAARSAEPRPRPTALRDSLDRNALRTWLHAH